MKERNYNIDFLRGGLFDLVMGYVVLLFVFPEDFSCFPVGIGFHLGARAL